MELKDKKDIMDIDEFNSELKILQQKECYNCENLKYYSTKITAITTRDIKDGRCKKHNKLKYYEDSCDDFQPANIIPILLSIRCPLDNILYLISECEKCPLTIIQAWILLIITAVFVFSPIIYYLIVKDR